VRTVIIANRRHPDAGYVEDALVARGAQVERHWREDDTPLPDPASVDAVVSLGSDWSVYWEHVAPSVARESAFLRDSVAAGVPVLGLCFGGQVLAHALGGAVDPAPVPEIGFYAVESDQPDLIPTGPYVQWHTDRFRPPPGAREVARTAAGPQAYVIGSALGLQFHPEAGPDVVRQWSAEGADTLTDFGLSGPEFVAEAEQRDGEARERAARIVATLLDGLDQLAAGSAA
jgi:GMP synthase-like glutamine amidotransferase